MLTRKEFMEQSASASLVGNAGSSSASPAAITFSNDGDTLRREGAILATVKNNFSASTDPGASDDTAAGYLVGSVWYNTTAKPAHT